MEKLETVKRLVRQNNYKNNDTTFKQCQALGVTVNRVGLEVFASKLKTMDRVDEIGPHNELSFEKSSYEPGSIANTQASSLQVSNVTQLNNAEIRRKPLSSDPVERKREITFELGTIKVREYELLQELNLLISNEKLAEAQ